MALRVLRIIHWALALGVMVVAGVASAVGGRSDTEYPVQMLSGVAAFVLLLAIWVGPWVARKVSGVRPDSDAPAERRLQQFVGYKLASAALIEGAGMMWAVIAFLSGEPMATIGAVVAALTILTRIPNATELESVAGLTIEVEPEAA